MKYILLNEPWGRGLLALVEILLIGIVLALATRTTLLRDANPGQPNFKLRAYSLAKSQLAFWTVVVIGSFIYVYFSKGVCFGVLNNTALLLLGISTGTTALSAAASGLKPDAASVPSNAVAAPATAAAPVIAEPNPANSAAAAAAGADHVPPALHENFLDDVLSDNEGINIHRLQMAIWTVVFGGIFIHQVIKGGEFPKFDDQAYVLMGISSVTYVWFKRTEK